MKGALSGIKVIDLSRMLPGPYCSMILADHGARVIGVESKRFLSDDLYLATLNRNKEHMSLDLKTKEGLDIFLKLVEDADVLLEGFRPGVTERLGITWFHTGDVTKLAVAPGVVSGAATTPVGPLYHEFSAWGAALGSFVFGWGMKVLYVTLVEERGTPAAIAIYTMFAHQAWLYTIGGSWQGLFHMQMAVYSTVLILFLARSRWAGRAHEPGEATLSAQPG